MGILLPSIDTEENFRPKNRPFVASLALSQQDDPQNESENEKEQEEEIELDAAMTVSERELLQTMDFEEMSTDEIEAAKRAISKMRLPITEIPLRRFQQSSRQAHVDMRATLRAALRSGAGSIPLKHRKRRSRPPPIVILCDISGSMSRYSRMFLHFMHA